MSTQSSLRWHLCWSLAFLSITQRTIDKSFVLCSRLSPSDTTKTLRCRHCKKLLHHHIILLRRILMGRFGFTIKSVLCLSIINTRLNMVYFYVHFMFTRWSSVLYARGEYMVLMSDWNGNPLSGCTKQIYFEQILFQWMVYVILSGIVVARAEANPNIGFAPKYNFVVLFLHESRFCFIQICKTCMNIHRCTYSKQGQLD